MMSSIAVPVLPKCFVTWNSLSVNRQPWNLLYRSQARLRRFSFPVTGAAVRTDSDKLPSRLNSISGRGLKYNTPQTGTSAIYNGQCWELYYLIQTLRRCTRHFIHFNHRDTQLNSTSNNHYAQSSSSIVECTPVVLRLGVSCSPRWPSSSSCTPQSQSH
jgi:hypothetical protein